MALVVFYEKPGCRNNTRQKALLRAARHTVDSRDLLNTAWTAGTLRPFFGTRPISEWFNPAAPRIKSGEIAPTTTTEAEALSLMLADPLLIRRPLMEANGEKRCGFDAATVDAWIGLSESGQLVGDVETCPRRHEETPCRAP